MTTFRAYRYTGLLRALAAGVFGVLGIGLAIRELLSPSDEYPWPLFFHVALILGAGFMMWQGLGVPRTIEWPRGEQIRLRTLRGTFLLDPKDIISIAPMADLLVVQCRGGKRFFNRGYEGFSGFIERLREVNPPVDIRGM